MLLTVCGSTLLTSCYDDKGGNDYDTPLADVEIYISENAFGAPLGELISITPTVKTTIDEKDLQYIWEVKGSSEDEFGHRSFKPLVSEEEQGKVLNYTTHLDENITTLNVAYDCRLHVRQVSTGRDFYSKNTFTITVSGKTGLMLLYGDEEGSDVGILQTSDFMPATMTIPATDNASPALFSMSNGGKLIEGKGKHIEQITGLYFSTYASYPGYDVIFGPRCGQVFAQTDKTGLWLKKEGLDLYGDWNSFFYLKGKDAVNKNQPRGILVYALYVFGFDGGDMFSYNAGSSFPFLFAESTPETAFTADGNTYDFTGQAIPLSMSYGIVYAGAVNGNNQKGFVRIPMNPGAVKASGVLFDTKDDIVPFNPGNTHADLMQMRIDSRSHIMAVMKGDATHPTLAGKYFTLDINPAGKALPDTKTTFSGMPLYQYDLSAMSDISSAIAFEFGSTQNMCYYATPSAVYQYRLDAGVASASEPLTMMDATPWSPQGEITMMKFLDNDQMTTPTHTADKVLMVATWQGGKAALWALHIDLASGRIKEAKKFDEASVAGWNFNKPILDASVKNM